MGTVSRKHPELFNTPFELGLRMVYLLFALRPGGADLQKLVLLDYAIVYSQDLGGPASLHTPVPYRNAELFSRRERIEQGLYLMSTRGLVDVVLDESGMTYIAGTSSFTMVGSLSSKYWRDLQKRCVWVAERFGQASTKELLNLFAESGHLWGAELETVKQPYLL
ncbi:threonine transporter RhtB [Burkholderia pseudomallei]|uniref:ABC-three component system middle component 2 n=1 Tax=Burkholderia pseudomallei TaxID=28450 RepID=UPI0005C974B6|nr:ABC-three component system middle component 2 [Burkholderia pseudomallei]KIX36911.1 threonine transporter RhtB [Burkholderia pseudomallei]